MRQRSRTSCRSFRGELAAVGALVALIGCGPGAAPQPASTGSAASNTAGSGAPTASQTALASASANPEENVDSGPPWFGLQARFKDEVAKVVNPNDETPYTGKTGTVKGKITLKGDAPPDALDPAGSAFVFPDECKNAPDLYKKLFRVGKDGALADAMVAVTEYKGFVPARERMKKVSIHRCAMSTKTIVATFGQRIEVSNSDGDLQYMPYLDGSPIRAMMVAMPKGKPIKLFPQKPGHYLVRDEMNRPFLIADAFVLPYATFDVTVSDGTYEIRGVPVGKVKVDAFLPVIDKSVGKEIEVKEGDNVVDLTLQYSAAKDKPVSVPAPIWGDRAPTAGSSKAAASAAPR